MSSVPFFIPNTSPLFSYTPCKDCEPTQGWQSTYQEREDGLDQTYHETGYANAQVAFNITASSLDFITESEDDCTGTYTINGSSPISACIRESAYLVDSLPPGLHRVQLTPNVPDPTKPFHFLGIKGTLQASTLTESYNSTIDLESYDDMQLEPADAWLHGDASGVATADFDLSHAYNKSLSHTSVANSSAEITYNASTIYVYSTTSSAGGKVQVSVDGEDAAIVDFNSPWTSYSALVYMHTTIDPTAIHSIKFTNMAADSILVLDYIILTGKQPPAEPAATSQMSTPVVAGIAAAGAVLVLLLILWGVLHFRQRRLQKRLRPLISNPRSASSPSSSLRNLMDQKQSFELWSGTSVNGDARSFYSYHPPVTTRATSDDTEAQAPAPTKSPLRSMFSLRMSSGSRLSPYDPQRASETYRARMLTLKKLVLTQPAQAVRRSMRASRRGTQSSFGDMMSPSTPFSDVMAIEDTAVRATRAEVRFLTPPPPVAPTRRLTPVVPYTQPRRNVSIKSAKSAKSFWSTLLSNSVEDAPPVPATPAVAARVDSSPLERHRYPPLPAGDIIIELSADSPSG